MHIGDISVYLYIVCYKSAEGEFAGCLLTGGGPGISKVKSPQNVCLGLLEDSSQATSRYSSTQPFGCYSIPQLCQRSTKLVEQ